MSTSEGIHSHLHVGGLGSIRPSLAQAPSCFSKPRANSPNFFTLSDASSDCFAGRRVPNTNAAGNPDAPLEPSSSSAKEDAMCGMRAVSVGFDAAFDAEGEEAAK